MVFDANFFAYAGVAALLVVSPGATMAVVADAAVDGGRRGGLWTVAGVATANFSLSTASAFGLTAVFKRAPQVLSVLAVCGGLYMGWLGLRAIARAIRRPAKAAAMAPRARKPGRGFTRGVITNYTNVSVVLFYTVVVPQFITAADAFLPRYLLLGNLHVAMSIVWLTAFAVSIGSLAAHMTKPAVRRTMDALTGCALMGFAAKLLFGA